jgi:hypothetical protein
MNWARDAAYLVDREGPLEKVFKYQSQKALVIKIVKSEEVTLKISHRHAYL